MNGERRNLQSLLSNGNLNSINKKETADSETSIWSRWFCSLHEKDWSLWSVMITSQNVFVNNLEKSIGKTMLTSISITYITWEFILIMCFFSGTSELQFINIFRHQWITIDKHLRITETSPFSLLMVKLLIVIVSLYGCSPESV